MNMDKDTVAGLLFVIAGGSFAVGAGSYEIGSSARMGPGFLPLLLGVLLALLGLLVMARARLRAAVGVAWAWRPLLAVLAANLAFGLLLGGLPQWGIAPMGLVVATLALTAFAGFADKAMNWKEIVLLALVLSAGSALVFVVLLRLPLNLWPQGLLAI
jgi:hypothetical protein